MTNTKLCSECISCKHIIVAIHLDEPEEFLCGASIDTVNGVTHILTCKDARTGWLKCGQEAKHYEPILINKFKPLPESLISNKLLLIGGADNEKS